MDGFIFIGCWGINSSVHPRFQHVQTLSAISYDKSKLFLEITIIFAGMNSDMAHWQWFWHFKIIYHVT